MISLLVVGMICGTVLYIFHRSEQKAYAQWKERAAERILEAQRDRDIESRRVTVLEREIALKERQFSEKPASEPMPDDLVDRCNSWEDDFAREEERAKLITLYAELHDWDKVRSKLPALRPFISEVIQAPRENLFQ